MSTRPSHLLISFCNTTAGAPALALLDLQSWAVSVLDVPDSLASERTTGLAISPSFVFVLTSTAAVQPGDSNGGRCPSGLWVFDRSDFSLLARRALSRVYDAHSSLIGPDSLDVVSTGTDEVIRVKLRGADVIGEDVMWRPDPGGPLVDRHHLNGICRWNDRVIVSGFGQKSGALWDSALAGFVVAIPSGEKIASATHPHSVISLGGTLAYCDSASGQLRMIGSDRTVTTPGYARGLCQVGSTIFIGTSRGRRTSKSTGRLTNRADPGTTTGRCSLVRCAIETMSVDKVMDLESLGLEIYDVVPVGGVERWPTVSETAWRDQLIGGMFTGLDEREATIAWLHTEVASRDKSIEWLQAEVSRRDGLIEALQAEAAHETITTAGQGDGMQKTAAHAESNVATGPSESRAQAIERSTMWGAPQPLRLALERFHRAARRVLRAGRRTLSWKRRFRDRRAQSVATNKA